MLILFWGLTSKLCPLWHKGQWWWWWWWWLECVRPCFLPHFCSLPTLNTIYRKNRKIAIHLKLSTILEILFFNYVVFVCAFWWQWEISKIEVVTVILQEAMVLEIKATIIFIVLPFWSILTMLVCKDGKEICPKVLCLLNLLLLLLFCFHHYCCGYLSLLVALQGVCEDFIENPDLMKNGWQNQHPQVPIKGKQNDIG